MAAFTASRHFMATLGAPRLVVLGEMGTAVPHAWRLPLAAAIVLWTNSLLEDRVRAQHLMRGCAHKNAGSGGFFTDSCAHGQRIEDKGNNKHFA